MILSMRIYIYILALVLVVYIYKLIYVGIAEIRSKEFGRVITQVDMCLVRMLFMCNAVGPLPPHTLRARARQSTREENQHAPTGKP